MNKITYLKGDATRSIGEGNKIICHSCNDIGAGGAGFVLAVSKRWKEPEEAYRKMNAEGRTLGTTMIVPAEDDISVANMIAQRGVGFSSDGQLPIRYGALRAAFAAANNVAYKTNATPHMPRIGCGLAGGKWNEVEKNN